MLLTVCFALGIMCRNTSKERVGMKYYCVVEKTESLFASAYTIKEVECEKKPDVFWDEERLEMLHWFYTREQAENFIKGAKMAEEDISEMMDGLDIPIGELFDDKE